MLGRAEPFRVIRSFGVEEINQGFLQPLIPLDQKPVQEPGAEELSVIGSNIHKAGPQWSLLFSRLCGGWSNGIVGPPDIGSAHPAERALYGVPIPTRAARRAAVAFPSFRLFLTVAPARQRGLLARGGRTESCLDPQFYMDEKIEAGQSGSPGSWPV
jgi:hypothetical protein